MPKQEFNPVDVAQKHFSAFEEDCEPKVCSKSDYKKALEELICSLEGALEAVKEEILEELEG